MSSLSHTVGRILGTFGLVIILALSPLVPTVQAGRSSLDGLSLADQPTVDRLALFGKVVSAGPSDLVVVPYEPVESGAELRVMRSETLPGLGMSGHNLIVQPREGAVLEIAGSLESLPPGTPVLLVQIKQDIIAGPVGLCVGPLASLDDNLASDVTCGLVGKHDRVGVAALGPLANNGGSTWSIAPLPGSSAIDVIPPVRCAQAFDQRGQMRPIGVGCDIGAIESALRPVYPLDSFEQANGRLGSSWFGPEGLGGYQIIGKQLDVLGGGPIYWRGQRYGVDQEAAITFRAVDRTGQEQDLLLKVQGSTPDWRKGVIEVLYDAHVGTVRVETYRPGAGWRSYPAIPLVLVDGDRLSAQAWADGRVLILRNGMLAGEITLNTTDRSFFASRTGWAGLWMINAGRALLDDFSAGSIALPK